MKFREIFRFELRYLLRHLSTWLLFAAFFLFGVLILSIVTLQDGTYLNAPGTIAFFTVFGSIIWVVIGGAVAGEAATRDIQTRMHPLIYTTPVRKIEYLGGKFLAAFLLNALILLTLFLGFLLSLYGPSSRTQFMDSFRFAPYLTNYFFVALPTTFATTSIQFTFSALSGRAIAGYIASIFIIIFSQFAGTTVTYGLEWKTLGGLMDLLGTSILADMEGWTPIEKNTRLILLEGQWLWNRVAWISIASGALAFTYFRFHLSHQLSVPLLFWRKSKSLSSQTENITNPKSEITNPKPEAQSPKSEIQNHNLSSHLRQVLAITRTSYSMIAKNRGGMTLVAMLAIGTGLFATEYMEWLGVPLFARTEEVLRILAPSLNSIKTQWIIIPLLTIFFAGELVWREREAGMNELSDTTPVIESVMLIGKFLGLALAIATWVALLMFAGIINQLVMGYHNFELDVYVKVLFGIQLTNYLLFAMLVFAVHVVVNQKYIAHMVAFCSYGFIVYAVNMGLEHKLLIYASDTGWSYSDMRGFGTYMKSWLWFKFYWVSWASLLAMVAVLMWVRSKENGVKTRVQLARHRISKYKTGLITAVVCVITSGGFIFYNTNLLNKYATKTDRMHVRAEYEKRYSKYQNAISPTLMRSKVHVEIYPENQTADIKATYFFVNRTKEAIDSIHISTLPYQNFSAMSFDRASTPLVLDNECGYRIYGLREKLNPGDSMHVSFEFQIGAHGFNNNGIDVPVVENGTHIQSSWLPILGYHDERRLHDVLDRRKFGLPARPAQPSLYDTAARYDTRDAERIEFEAIVGTAKDQIAVAPGTLLRKWTKGDRQYFQYLAESRIHNEYAFFSARYAVHESTWMPELTSTHNIRSNVGDSFKPRPVAVQIYYHPTHAANVERMMKSIHASLTYYSKEFGPYPYENFRVIERPGAGRGMHAEPMTIDYQEGYSLMHPGPRSPDLPYHIMSHEVAHQWWGFQLFPAAVEGSGLLVESFATYSAMQVVEETLGREQLLRYLSQMREEYEVPRSSAAPPLLQANNRFLNYRKGPFALFALRNYIGKDQVNDAMRAMLSNSPSTPPLPTTLEFYEELKRVTPDSLQYLVHDLFAANTFWDLQTESAVAKKNIAGGWELKLEVNARKFTVDSLGIETDVPMHDWVEIGIYAAKKVHAQPNVLYLEKHRVASGKQIITINVSEHPDRAGIDPDHLLIDLDLENNTSKVKGQPETNDKPENPI